ncbi:MAG: hypothetical protein Sylvanvirus15_4 [Sylvanvirus sp.]|uniref:Uncharacterized protein n=1 Tax=Sylvanvirus sp. TaxID=2487774 RepID=A0A3G5AI95_9VIRU|nr:MAG: hypothetical protein Sylvanvirus15_4 [Sylvanvirus sp.]
MSQFSPQCVMPILPLGGAAFSIAEWEQWYQSQLYEQSMCNQHLQHQIHSLTCRLQIQQHKNYKNPKSMTIKQITSISSAFPSIPVPSSSVSLKPLTSSNLSNSSNSLKHSPSIRTCSRSCLVYQEILPTMNEIIEKNSMDPLNQQDHVDQMDQSPLAHLTQSTCDQAIQCDLTDLIRKDSIESNISDKSNESKVRKELENVTLILQTTQEEYEQQKIEVLKLQSLQQRHIDDLKKIKLQMKKTYESKQDKQEMQYLTKIHGLRLKLSESVAQYASECKMNDVLNIKIKELKRAIDLTQLQGQDSSLQDQLKEGIDLVNPIFKQRLKQHGNSKDKQKDMRIVILELAGFRALGLKYLQQMETIYAHQHEDLKLTNTVLEHKIYELNYQLELLRPRPSDSSHISPIFVDSSDEYSNLSRTIPSSSMTNPATVFTCTKEEIERQTQLSSSFSPCTCGCILHDAAAMVISNLRRQNHLLATKVDVTSNQLTSILDKFIKTMYVSQRKLLELCIKYFQPASDDTSVQTHFYDIFPHAKSGTSSSHESRHDVVSCVDRATDYLEK